VSRFKRLQEGRPLDWQQHGHNYANGKTTGNLFKLGRKSTKQQIKLLKQVSKFFPSRFWPPTSRQALLFPSWWKEEVGKQSGVGAGAPASPEPQAEHSKGNRREREREKQPQKLAPISWVYKVLVAQKSSVSSCFSSAPKLNRMLRRWQKTISRKQG